MADDDVRRNKIRISTRTSNSMVDCDRMYVADFLALANEVARRSSLDADETEQQYREASGKAGF